MLVKELLPIISSFSIIICKNEDDVNPLYWGRAIQSLLPEELMNKKVRYITSCKSPDPMSLVIVLWS